MRELWGDEEFEEGYSVAAARLSVVKGMARVLYGFTKELGDSKSAGPASESGA